MENNEAGAFLNITPDILKKLDSFDEKLEKIEKHAHTAADALKNGFGSVVIDTTKLENVITSLAKKIDAIKGNPFEGAGKGAEETTRKTTSLNESLSRAADLLNRIGNNKIGEGSFANFNISGLKQGYSDLKKYVENMDLSKPQQKAAVEAMRYMKMELDEQRKTDEQRAQSKEKETERRIAADRRAYKASADLAKAQNYKQNTTAQGALDFSKTANTLQRQITAIEYLKKARLSLNTTDANYKSTLEQINQAIAKHNQALTEAGVKSQQLATRHRNLMDTAGQLSRQLALVFSVSQIQGYIDSIAKVRGEFELQQRSLQAILQNRTKADTVFNKTMALALDSPFRAQQLITYTKQLAAYRIESDKLYDTTKRLAEVSAGLGVSMDRLILAYGQVKAAAYLRGSEVRQFTEAGINMYGELQRYFQEIKGEAYTTAQIVDMISKRKVTFEDVENIFQRMTNEGGIFYNMQHIQVETLSGKIGKLRDAIDQMKNSIGKENEGIFKGSIDAATVLVQNWDKIANVGYALAGVFLMLKTQSISTGVAMSKVFTTEFAAGSKYALKPLELLRIKFWDLQKATINFGKSMKAAFVTNLPALALTATVLAGYKIFDKISSYTNAVSKANEELVKARGAVADLANEYKNLETATNKAKQVQERNNDPATDIKARRNALQKLIDLANKEGLTFEVKVSEVKEEELDAVFNGIKEQYERFLLDMAIIEKNHAKNERNRDWWFFSDAINEDADDYRNAVLDVLAQSDKMDMAIANVKTNYDNLSESSKEYYNIIVAGKKDGESQIDYYTRMYNAMLQINRLNVGTNTGVPQWLKSTNTILKDVSGNFKNVGTQAKELEEELDNVLGEVIANARKNGATDIQIQARIDKYAAQQGFDDIKKDLAYQHFGINISINQDSVDKETSWVDNYLKKFFEKRTYKINLDMTQPIDAKVPFEDFVKKGDEAAKAAKSWEEVEKRIATVGENAKKIEVDSKIANFLNSQSSILNIKSGDMVDVKLILDTISEYKKTQTDLSNALGVNPFEKKGGNAERDIWAERISVLKEMQSRYEKLNQLMDEARAIEETRSAFKGALDFTKMSEVIKAEDIIPTKQGMIDALERLLAAIPNDVKNAAKRTGLEKEIAELKIGIRQDYLKQQLDITKKNIEDMFNGLDLHQKLKDAGLTEAEVQQLFPGLAKTLDDVQKGIEIEFQTKYGDTYKDPNTQQYKDYQDAIKELEQQRIKDSQDLVIELTKAYKTQLSDQLQLDMWYYKERSKIYTKVYDEQTKTFKDVLTKEMQEQYSKNLKTQYDKKSSENTWKAFKGTDTYLNMFDNLENVSTKAIENMKAKLETLKEQMKDLDPSQLKEVMNFYNKMDEQLFKRSPLESFLKSYEKIKELKSQGITEEGLLQRIAENDIENTNLQQQISDLNTIIALKKESIEKDSVESSFIEKNKDLYNQSISVLESMVKAKQDTINDNNKENENANKNLKYFKDARSSLEYMKSAWDSVRNAGRQAMGSIVSILETMGEDTDSTSMRLLNMVGTIGDLVIQAVIFQLQLGLCTEAAKEMGVAMNAALGPIGWVLIALQAVATILSSIFGNHDKDLQKEIEEHERKIKKLEREYDKLKESIDNVWDITKLQEYGNELDENINKQIVSLNAMIAAERDKKDTDWDKINEWQEQIEDLRDTLADSANDMIAELGGVGSDENFKTLAENFASAWLEAFQETGDGLSGLQESFDDFMENYVKQQILLRLSDKFLKPMFEEFDNLIATRTDMEQEDQERYFELQAQITKLRNTANNSVIKSVAKKANAAADEIENSEEYKKLQEAWTDFLKPNDINTEAIKDWSDRMQGVFGEYNEAAEEIFNQIGWEPGGKANLSALQQGIQGITETTAEALEALLNSIRFFVSQQTTDITAIRNLLDARYSLESQAETNPMLIELKAQTGYLEIISDRIDRVFAPNSNSRGAGLRVFISD